LGLGAAFAWDAWFNERSKATRGLGISFFLLLSSVGLVVLGWVTLTWGQPLIQSAAAWFIQHCLMGDSLHTQSLSHYLEMLPGKLSAVAENLNPKSPRVWGPLLFLSLLTLTVWNRQRWNLSFQKGLLLILVLTDLAAFRMPLGMTFYSPQDLSQPQTPSVQNRALPLISRNNSPLPPQYAEYAFPDMNLISRSPVLPFYTSPPLGRYDTLLADLGWFAWVYKGRDLMGFTHHIHLLSVLGVDQIVSDTPFDLPKPFTTLQDHLPYAYGLAGTQPKAWLADQYEISPWPDSIQALERKNLDPAQVVLVESDPGFSSSKEHHRFDKPLIREWNETHLILNVTTEAPALLVLQKTFLPGWQATVNDKLVEPQIADLVLTAIPLPPGKSRIEMIFTPLSLRLGFFVLLVFLGGFILSWGCFLL
jgi:hypothetical protein